MKKQQTRLGEKKAVIALLCFWKQSMFTFIWRARNKAALKKFIKASLKICLRKQLHPTFSKLTMPPHSQLTQFSSNIEKCFWTGNFTYGKIPK